VKELEKYPLSLARERLARMNVVLDATPSGDTDYFVIPDSMAAAPPAGAGGEEGEEEPEEGAANPAAELERVEKLARTFGATVITERMLNSFLDY
jgi:hypothetical protein